MYFLEHFSGEIILIKDLEFYYKRKLMHIAIIIKEKIHIHQIFNHSLEIGTQITPEILSLIVKNNKEYHPPPPLLILS